MSRISSSMLSNTLNLVALAREAALAGGKPMQAQDLAPAEDGLRAAAESVRRAAAPSPSAPTFDAGMQTLLALRPANPAGPTTAAAQSSAQAADRLGAAQAMSAGGMSELDIARHLGASREEVQLWLNVGRKR